MLMQFQQDLYVVDVYNDVFSVDEGVWVLARGGDVGIVILYLGSWFVSVDLVLGAVLLTFV
jgi:hypothetical protein